MVFYLIYFYQKTNNYCRDSMLPHHASLPNETQNLREKKQWQLRESSKKNVSSKLLYTLLKTSKKQNKKEAFVTFTNTDRNIVYDYMYIKYIQ